MAASAGTGAGAGGKMTARPKLLRRSLIAGGIVAMGGSTRAAHSQGGDAGKLRIRITTKATTTVAMLEPHASARDFQSLLPLSVTLEDYASTEKIAYLPRKLMIQGAPEGYEPRAGDIAYYAPWGNLAIFYKDFRYSPALVKLGAITDGLETLSRHGSLNVTIASVGDTTN